MCALKNPNLVTAMSKDDIALDLLRPCNDQLLTSEERNLALRVFHSEQPTAREVRAMKDLWRRMNRLASTE